MNINEQNEIREDIITIANEEDYKLYDDLLKHIGKIKKGETIAAVVSHIDNYFVFVDLKLKADAKIPREEFYVDGHEELPQKGQVINVVLESLEDINGNVLVSYSKAVRQKKWEELIPYFQKKTPIEGFIIRKVHGGFTVNIFGINAFLPRTYFLTDSKNSKDLVGSKIMCTIFKMDKKNNSIILFAKNSNDIEMLSNFSLDQIVEGTVKKITDSYASVELSGGIVGRLNIKDISWERIENINDKLKIDEVIQVKIIGINENSNRIDLSIKEIEGNNPWVQKLKNLNISKGKEVNGTILKIEDKIMYVTLVEDISGTLLTTEISNDHQFQNFKDYKIGTKINVKIIDIIDRKNRIVLSVKKLDENSLCQFKVGSQISAEVTGLSEFGYKVKIKGKISGIIPNSSYYVDGRLTAGQVLEVYVHNTDNDQLILGTKPLNIS